MMGMKHNFYTQLILFSHHPIAVGFFNKVGVVNKKYEGWMRYLTDSSPVGEQRIASSPTFAFFMQGFFLGGIFGYPS